MELGPGAFLAMALDPESGLHLGSESEVSLELAFLVSLSPI